MLPDPPISAVRPIERPPSALGAGLSCHIPGLALTLALAVGALALGRWSLLQDQGISALTLAILIGIVLGNSAYARIATRSDAGVAFAKQTLLRAGIILYGLRLTFQDIGHVGELTEVDDLSSGGDGGRGESRAVAIDDLGRSRDPSGRYEFIAGRQDRHPPHRPD